MAAMTAAPPDGLALADPQTRPADEVARLLSLEPALGLEATDAAARLEAVGRNELEAGQRESVLLLLVGAATQPFVVLLLIAAVLAIALGEVRDGLLVLVGLLPIVGADVVTEYRGQQALEALRAASAPLARVRRDGVVDDLPAPLLVPGDLVLLRTGDVVPADLRLWRTDGLQLDRSTLTGESLPEPGLVRPDAPGIPLAEVRAMAHAGTSVVAGRAEGIVVATGQRTAFGAIATGLARRERRRSPLQLELDRLVRILLVVAIGLIIVTTGLGFARGNPPAENILAGVSAAIAAIPEEPPILLAVILGLGAYRLLRRNVLVRRLNAEEMLGAVDLILTDKTGTLTANRLAVRDVRRPAGPFETAAARQQVLLDALRAEEDAWRLADGVRPGSFTRGILAALDELGLEGLPWDEALVEAQGPTDERPYSWSVARRGDRIVERAIGAPESILGLADGLPPDELGAWHELVDAGAGEGGRLILLAQRIDSGPWRPQAVLDFADPLRPHIADAVALARRAGIQVLVVTGDHPRTARAIAVEAGLSGAAVVTGTQLDAWDDAQLGAELADLQVVARAVPEQKLRLVHLARERGRTVAVTGDGVNDAPALHAADVAVAMGSGTEVAKEASDLVLGDDSFATLTYALREGRRIIANVRSGLVFLVSTHVALLGFLFIATLAGYALPLLPIQILWLELFIDLSTSVAFEREREAPGAMDLPPRPRGRPILTNDLLVRIVAAGGFSALMALLLIEGVGTSPAHAQWLAFTTLVVAQVVRAYSNRSLTLPVWRLPRNAFLLASVTAVMVIQAALPYLPYFAEAFRAVPLDATEWTLVALIALAPSALAQVVRATTGRTWVA